MKSCRFGAAAAAVVLVDVAGEDEVDQRLRQRLHLEERALGDRLGNSSGLFSRISSSMRLLVTITSTAAMRPPPMRGSSRWRDDAAAARRRGSSGPAAA